MSPAPVSRILEIAGRPAGAASLRRIVRTLVLAACLALTASPALAARAPTRSERAVIKRVALEHCAARPDPCRFRGARVSTRGERYAWATVIGEGLSGVLLKRPSARSRHFRSIGVQGGGARECSYWRRRAPARVRRDLRLRGLVDDTGATPICR